MTGVQTCALPISLSYSIVNNTAASDIVAPTSYYNQTSSAWARVSFTFTTPVGCASILIYPLRDGGSTGTVLLWGAQLEVGSFATSYIPTGAASAARSADVCSITGANFTSFWNQSEGTMFAASTRLQPTGLYYNSIIVASDGTNNNRIFIGNGGNPNDIEFVINKFNVTEYNGSINNGGLVRRGALAYSQSSSNRSYNGNIGTDDTSSAIPAVTQLIIGAGQVISSTRYYKKRLSNAKLQALTV